jgi:hypothetical protein
MLGKHKLATKTVGHISMKRPRLLKLTMLGLFGTEEWKTKERKKQRNRIEM